ncbi:MAG: hypothetical protein ABH871_07295 [Pseudomonadota bacterium]
MTTLPNMVLTLPAFLASTVQPPNYVVSAIGPSKVGIALMPPQQFNRFSAIALSGGQASDQTTDRYVSDSNDYTMSYYGGMPFLNQRVKKSIFDAAVVRTKKRHPALINVNVNSAGASANKYSRDAAFATLTIATTEGIDSVVFPMQFGRTKSNGNTTQEEDVVVRAMLAGIRAFMDDMPNHTIHSILICIRDKKTLQILRHDPKPLSPQRS